MTAVSILAENVRARRVELGLTQEQLGRKTGLSTQAINRIELGRTKKPHRLTVAVISEALDVPVSELERQKARES